MLHRPSSVLNSEHSDPWCAEVGVQALQQGQASEPGLSEPGLSKPGLGELLVSRPLERLIFLYSLFLMITASMARS